MPTHSVTLVWFHFGSYLARSFSDSFCHISPRIFDASLALVLGWSTIIFFRFCLQTASSVDKYTTSMNLLACKSYLQNMRKVFTGFGGRLGLATGGGSGTICTVGRDNGLIRLKSSRSSCGMSSARINFTEGPHIFVSRRSRNAAVTGGNRVTESFKPSRMSCITPRILLATRLMPRLERTTCKHLL